MKITGGNFGTKGRAYIDEVNSIVIESDINKAYARDQIGAVEANTNSDRRFSVGSFILGIAILLPILGFLFNLAGVVVALVLTIVGSYYTTKQTTAKVTFTDGKVLNLDCTDRAAKKLINLTQ